MTKINYKVSLKHNNMKNCMIKSIKCKTLKTFIYKYQYFILNK